MKHKTIEPRVNRYGPILFKTKKVQLNHQRKEKNVIELQNSRLCWLLLYFIIPLTSSHAELSRNLYREIRSVVDIDHSYFDNNKTQVAQEDQKRSRI